MKDCIIFYNAEELPKNRFFAESIKTSLEELGINAAVSTEKELEYVPKIAVNRTRDAVLAKHLEENGCRVFNDFQICTLGNDKQKAYEFFSAKGIPMLESCFFGKGDEAVFESFPCVAKPAHGHGGMMVELVNNGKELKTACKEICAAGDTAVVQPCASTLGVDLRCYVLGGEIIAAVRRSSEKDFRANFTLGGSCEAVVPNKEEIEIVNSVCCVTTPDFIGVDIIYNGGRPVLNEIEDAVGCRMLYTLGVCDPAKLFAEYIKRNA